MSVFNGKLSKKEKAKTKKTGKKKVAKSQVDARPAETKKFRITGEIALTGNQKNPLKSKMTGFFIKFSFKDDDKKQKIKQEALTQGTKAKRIKNKE